MVATCTGLGSRVTAAALVVCLSGGGLSRVLAHNPGDTSRLSDRSAGDDWAAYGRTFGEQHFSPLAEIDATSVSRLGLRWSIDLGRGLTATVPVAVNGVLYFSTGYSVIRAVDGLTGKTRWQYDPGVPAVAKHSLWEGWGARGISYWNGKIYTGTHDGRLIAIDATSGKPVWTAHTFIDEKIRFISGAPMLFDGKVIIGHGGADSDDIRGYVTTYDAETGQQLWRFYTVPGNPADGFENDAMSMAAKTWAGEWWRYGGGGSVWNAMAYDPDTDTVFVGTGNGSPWNHKIRSAGKGDNLFLCSIIALRGKDGAYKWHYQVNPAESWDYNAAMDIELAELDIHGSRRKVLITAPKNGFFYVIDRSNGKLISAAQFTKQTWASRIDVETGRPVELPGIRFPAGTKYTLWPGPVGGHSSLPMAYSQLTRFAYLPVTNTSATFSDPVTPWKRVPGGSPDGSVSWAVSDVAPDPLDGTSTLLAWDVAGQKKAWEIATPGLWNGGVMATGGNLVFQGQIDGAFNAYAAPTGRRLWSFASQAPINAAPISYAVGGHQFVTVLTGVSGAAAVFGELNRPFHINPRTSPKRVLTFALDGQARLPTVVDVPVQPVADPTFRPDVAQAQRGAAIYGRHCLSCHGAEVESGGFAPDLRASSIPQSAAAFTGVVHDGNLLSNGMPQFDNLAGSDLEDLRHYIRSRAYAFAHASAGAAAAASTAN